MKRRMLLLSISIIFVAAPVAWADWVTETVATVGTQGEYAGIALDSNDIPHASWYDATNAQLIYGVRNFDGWDTTVVDANQKGRFSHIAINPVTDQPAIAYRDDLGGEAKYAWYDGAWHNEQIDYSDFEDEGQWIDIAFTSQGVPFVSYLFDNGAFERIGGNACWRIGGWWDCHQVQDWVWPAVVGSHTAIAMDSGDQPQIAYRDELGGIQKFGWRDGGGWNTEDAADTADSSGEYAGIALDLGDNIYISSFDSGLLADNCIALFTKTSGGWSKEQIECDSADDFGKYSDVTVATDGTIYVTYHADNELRLAVKQGGDWAIEVLDADPDAGQWTGIALDSRQSPHIIYYYAGGRDVRYIWNMDAPEVLAITPESGMNSETVSVTITGAGFSPESTASLYFPDSDTEIQDTNLDINSGSELTCDFDLDGQWPGVWDVHVTNPAGVGALEDGFTIETETPVLTGISPDMGRNGNDSFDITLTGESFAEPMTAVLIGPGRANIFADSVVLDSLTEAQATFDLVDRNIGDYDLKIATDFGESTLPGAFEIACGLPKADFNAAPTAGIVPLSVQFTDQSTDYTDCVIHSWEWNFGDGETSVETNPMHEYAQAGIYQVTLKTTSPGGADSEIKSNCIDAQDEPVDDDADDDADDDDDDQWNPPNDDADDDDTDDDTEEAGTGDDDDDSAGGCCSC